MSYSFLIKIGLSFFLNLEVNVFKKSCFVSSRGVQTHSRAVAYAGRL